jgi:methionine sulfoxide reductase heme-binding subunit
MLKTRGSRVVVKLFVWALCLAPFLRLAWRIWQQDVTPNPVEFITHFTGDWTIRFLVATLAITPLRKLLNLPELIRFRRLIGLFTFFYACLHFATYLWLDHSFDMAAIVKDVAKRPYVTAGFTAFALMVPLAITSTAGWIRRLGGKRWQRLHQLIYISAVAAVTHYYWLVKSDIRLPALYGALVALELGYRVAVRQPWKSATKPS